MKRVKVAFCSRSHHADELEGLLVRLGLAVEVALAEVRGVGAVEEVEHRRRARQAVRVLAGELLCRGGRRVQCLGQPRGDVGRRGVAGVNRQLDLLRVLGVGVVRYIFVGHGHALVDRVAPAVVPPPVQVFESGVHYVCVFRV